MADPDTVLAYSNVGHTETGYLYAWKWRTGAAPARANDVRAPTSRAARKPTAGSVRFGSDRTDKP